MIDHWIHLVDFDSEGIGVGVNPQELDGAVFFEPTGSMPITNSE